MTRDEAIRKAMACLRLAERGGTPEESAAAAAAAQKILDRFQLDANDLDFDANAAERDSEEVKDFGYEDPLEKVDYLKPWMLRLASVVARANNCRIVYQQCDFTGSGRNRGASIKIIGRPSDVQIARYVHGYLRGEVVRLRDSNCKGQSNTYKRQFALGVVETIQDKLDEQRQATEQELRNENVGNSLALVRVNNAIAKREQRYQDVVKFVQQTMPKLGKGRVTGNSQTGLGDVARHHGRKVGEQVRLTRATSSLGSGAKQIGN